MFEHGVFRSRGVSSTRLVSLTNDIARNDVGVSPAAVQVQSLSRLPELSPERQTQQSGHTDQ